MMTIEKKLQWACRRGMLELDVLLMNFLNEAYPSLTPGQKETFVELLTQPDPDLMAWIMGREPAPNEAFAELAQKIYQHARSRLST